MSAPGSGQLVDLHFPVGRRQRTAALYLPRGYEEGDRSWPLIGFLHGLGERGDDGREQTQGLLPAIQEHPERFPCLVLMPQCPHDRVWVPIDASWARGDPPAEEHIDAALQAACAAYRVDAARISPTGLSMGGFGALRYGARCGEARPRSSVVPPRRSRQHRFPGALCSRSDTRPPCLGPVRTLARRFFDVPGVTR